MSSTEASGVKLVRRSIIAYVVLFVLTLGFPLYYGTTKVDRADLPIAEIDSLSSQLLDKINIKIPVNIISEVELSNDFFGALGYEIRETISSRYPLLTNLWELDVQEYLSDKQDGYKVNIKKKVAGEVFYAYPDRKEVDVFVDNVSMAASTVKGVLLDEIFDSETAEISSLMTGEKLNVRDAIPQSDVTNIVFSLLVEDGKPAIWEVQEVIKQFDSVIESLNHISKFQVSTQIQYYSALTHEPLSLINDESKYIVAEEDLSTFINYGDWNINNYDVHPTINFLVFFPKCNYENKQLLVQNSATNSFLVPQWGGVHIFNKNFPILRLKDPITITQSELEPVFEVFTVQLLKLLGASDKPHAPIAKIDTLTRLKALHNLKRSLDNLKSLVKVTDSLSDISIPDKTKVYVAECISEVEKSINMLNNQLYENATVASVRALLLSDSAFFDKEMVQQAYFPSEHKLAVFLPLLGPIGSIVTLSLIKLVKERRQKKAAKNLTKPL